MTSPNSLTERYAWLRLSLEPGLGPATARKLLAHFGLPNQIYAQSVGTLSRYLPITMATQLHAEPTEELAQLIEQTLNWGDAPDQHILCLADDTYPAALLNLHDPPLVLYGKGQLEQLQYQGLAIVGARSATQQGLENARGFARFLASEGWCIVSGMAAGIDAAAHEGALSAQQPNNTLAVLATGMDRVYPASNRDLAHRIAEQGLLISEFHLGQSAMRHHFVRRNRLVAALSRGVLVVEAALKSGSLSTARLATEIGREVFAIPGSIHSPLHKGCHQLIRQGAKLVESAEHIVEEMGHNLPLPFHISTSTSVPATSQPKPLPDHLSAAQKIIMQTLGTDAMTADQIQHLCPELSIAEVGVELAQLELLDVIQQQSPGVYVCQ